MLKSLPGKELLPASPLLRLTGVVQSDSDWIVMADSLDRGACPKCGGMSVSRHSQYIRTLQDLPAFGAAVKLQIRVCRWRCSTPGCAVRVFADRLPGVAEFRGRRTCRANGVARWIGYALGGRPGERLTGRIGLQISKDTLLRLLKKYARPPVSRAQVVGVDEWARCKGRTYGTIVVDLERNTVVDVLDRHSTEVVENWLSAHPEIHTICRDRNGRYAKAARKGAPAAKQIADRFHLVQNLREAVERELAMHRAYLRVRLTPNGFPGTTRVAPVIGMTDLPARVPVARERRLPPARRLATQMEIKRQIRQNGQDLFDKFKALQTAGVKISAIAQQLGFNRRRFDKWAKQSELPQRNKMQPRPGSAETFREYLRERWDAGYRNGRMLLDEIRALGYAGTYKALGKVVSPWRIGNIAFEKSTSEVAPNIAETPLVLTDPAQRQISPQIAAALLAKPRPELTDRQAEIVDALKAGCPGYAAMRTLMMGFRSILRQPKLRPSKTQRKNARNVAALHNWMERARASGIASIQNFEYQLRRDILAVEAAVTEKWSNGPVEGQVNRLKTLKRQMYGRAGAELLRARLIPMSVESPLLQRE